MQAAGSVTAEALVCRKGEEEWMGLDDELSAMEIERGPVLSKPVASVSRQPSFEESMRRRDEDLAGTFGKTINWITAIICLAGAVPLLGILAYGVWGLWAFVATGLCMMQMSKGQVSGGIWNLIGVWVFAPLIIAGLQFASLSIFGALANR